jgi:N-acetyl-anhydromuramyl-L-alanine amidase AmpD
VGNVRKSERKFIVFTSLVGVLTLTSALLLALAPAPLSPEQTNKLLAIEAPQSVDRIFQTTSPIRPGQWKYIYVHHSKTPVNDPGAMALQRANGLSDHFLIGPNETTGTLEIEIGQRWLGQFGAIPPEGASKLDPSTVSICVVGDFDRTLPTPAQMQTITQLVTTLQSRLSIPAQNVVIATGAVGTRAGAGKYFPTTAFRDGLIR